MSFFGVTVETIREIKPHNNADKLELAYLEDRDYQFVIGKNAFKKGDRVFYFPVDSLIPLELQKKMGVEGYLAGSQKNKVKQIRLRGEYSAGLVADISIAKEYNGDLSDSESLTNYFGVIKYEPPEVFHKTAILRPLPMGLSKYDIENAETYPKVLQELRDVVVCVTEKLEGQNVSISFNPYENKVYVNQRRHTIIEKEDQENIIWKVARNQGLIDFAKYLSRGTNRRYAVYGEFIGPSVQGNIYNLKTPQINIFDIKCNNIWLDFIDIEHAVVTYFQDRAVLAPIISSDKTLSQVLDGKTIDEYSTGRSILANFVLREGVVIKPIREMLSNVLNDRLIIKHRSREYLSNSKL